MIVEEAEEEVAVTIIVDGVVVGIGLSSLAARIPPGGGLLVCMVRPPRLYPKVPTPRIADMATFDAEDDNGGEEVEVVVEEEELLLRL